MAITTVLLIAALVVFLLATFGVDARVNLIALGLALVTLAFLVGRVG